MGTGKKRATPPPVLPPSVARRIVGDAVTGAMHAVIDSLPDAPPSQHTLQRVLEQKLVRVESANATLKTANAEQARKILALQALIKPPGFCASCTAESSGLCFTELSSGKFAWICVRCNTEHPREGGYAFGESSDQSKAANGSIRDRGGR